MEPSSHRKTFELLRGAIHFFQYIHRVQGYAPGVSRCLAVAQVDGRPKRVQSVRITTLDLPKSAPQLHRSLADHLFEILAILFHLLFQILFAESTLETH